jgi:hypothetical protein
MEARGAVRRGGLLCILALALGCRGGTETKGNSTTGQAAAEGRFINKAELGEKWPFTVESGYVDCPDGLSAIFRTGDTEYGLNGMATARGFADPEPIWMNDPSIPGAKIDIGPMIDLARQECK